MIIYPSAVDGWQGAFQPERTFMKKVNLIVFSIIIGVRLASASNNFSYTATAAPGSTPDGTDQNSNPVNVWTLTPDHWRNW